MKNFCEKLTNRWWKKTIIGLAVVLVALNIYGRQPYDPVGDDVVDFDQSSLVVGENQVEYLSNGSKIAATLRVPETYVPGEKLPMVIVTPPNTGVKEQTAGLYAERLTELGYLTLAFDPRGFGDSGGHHVLFDLTRQVEDVRSSVDFVTTLDMVDQDKIFNLGICVGAALATYETAFDDRVKAVAMVSPVYLTPEENILPIPMDIAYIMSGFAKVVRGVTGYDVPLGPLVVRDASNDDEPETTLGAGMDEYYLEGQPGYATTWENHFSLVSMVPVMQWFDFFAAAPALGDTPSYMVYGTEAFSRPGAERFYDLTTGPKDKLVLESAGHFDIYWMPEFVDPAVAGVDGFFSNVSNK